MGYSLRYFIAEDDGTLTRVPVAKCHRWFPESEALPAPRAGRELRLLEAVVDVDRDRVVAVLRILPVRHQGRKDGRLDASAAMRRALKRRAFELAQQAIARDDSLALAHRLLSQVYLWKKQHEPAIAEAERAVARGPNDADGYETLAEVLAWSGRAEEAIGFIKKAMRLNPQYPFFYLWTLGHAYYLTGRTQEAIDSQEASRAERQFCARPRLPGCAVRRAGP